jgi:hypothetical protein
LAYYRLTRGLLAAYWPSKANDKEKEGKSKLVWELSPYKAGEIRPFGRNFGDYFTL